MFWSDDRCFNATGCDNVSSRFLQDPEIFMVPPWNEKSAG